MQEVIEIESLGGSMRIAGTAYTPVRGRVIEVVASAVIAKLRETGIAADSGAGTAQVVNITLSGTAGTCLIKYMDQVFTVTFNTSLTQTAADFVTSNSAAFTALGLTLTSSSGVLIFTAPVAGIAFDAPTVQKQTGNLVGVTTVATPNGTNPLLIHGVSGATLAAGEKVYAKTEFLAVQLTSGTIMVR